MNRQVEAMKRAPIFLILFTLSFSTLFAGAFLNYFKGHSDGNNVVVEWQTRDESNVNAFEVQRRAGSSTDFVTLATVNPQGSNSSYSYVDRSAYKEAAGVYIYRLKITDRGSDQASYSNEITIYHNSTGVKRTWGSIKAMFR
jgi:hypothetical protein